MRIITDPSEFQSLCLEWRAKGVRLGFVPTMGYFHDGHLRLMDAARAETDRLAVSIFVNPTQFGPSEDLAAYPRDMERDTALARERGADVLFTPSPEAMYQGPEVWVDVPEVSRHLCGASRPGHFRGVATVVAKLLLLAMPHLAVFGEKDRQQLAVIRAMARQLFIPTIIKGHSIVREADGLAMSSRNVYLSADERAMAPMIHRGLTALRDDLAAGERDVKTLLTRLRERYGRTLPLGEVDYVEIVHPETMTPLSMVTGPAVAAVAVRLGRARLIDNIELTPS